MAQTGIQFGENIYFNVWFNVIILVGGLKKGIVRSWGGSAGHISLRHEGEKKGVSDSITVGSSATHIKLCIPTSIRKKRAYPI